MKSTLPAFCLFIFIIAFSLRGLGQGVTTPSFGPSAVTESFEGIPTSDNNYSNSQGYTVPVTPFTFGSGITLTLPADNGPYVVNIADNNKGQAGWALCNNQWVYSTDVPDGAAYLAAYNTPPLLTFTLPVPAGKVGVYVEGCPGTITLTAYNASNEVIGSSTTEATGIPSNWKDHFLGFNSLNDGIAKITISGHANVLDKLTFEKQQECLMTPSFGPSAVTESFENIATSDSNTLYAGGYTKPVTPFTFPSGIRLTEPNPNTDQVHIGDFSKGNTPLYRCNSTILATAADVPDGTAFLSMYNAASTLTFTLPAPSRRVGLYVEGVTGTCVSSTTITLTAYNASNVVIGSCTTEATDDGTNWKNHFLGFNSLGDGIAKITLTGPYIDIDKLTFEPLPCVPTTWYLDADNDGYYKGNGVSSCTSPGAGYRNTGLTAGSDCDDADPNVGGPITLYKDNDHDGFGDPNNSKQVCPNDDPSAFAGYVTDNSDCDDTKMLFADMDGDGVAGLTRVACGGSPNGGLDCDDNNPNIQSPIVYFADVDGDGYGDHNSPLAVCSTTPPIVNGTHYVSNGADCDDGNAQINPNTVWYLDADGDGYYTGTGITSCVEPPMPGYKYDGLLGGNDCDDANALVHTQYPFYVDQDGDGYGAGSPVSVCAVDANTPPTGYSLNNTDCAPSDPVVWQNCTVVVPYTLSIADASQPEGNKGKSNMSFTVTLSKAFSKKVTVQYRTQNGTATAGSDYTAKSGTLTFKPGSVKQKVAIPIIGDKTIEPNETFSVVLSNPVNAELLNGTSTGTILNDDGTLTTMQAVDLKAVAGEASGNLAVTVSPNPSHSYFTLHMQSSSDKPLMVRTFDALGREIEARGNVPSNGTLMLGGNYRPGMYFTQVLQGNKMVTVKLLKQSN